MPVCLTKIVSQSWTVIEAGQEFSVEDRKAVARRISAASVNSAEGGDR
jgi:hypothetical protein